MGTGPGTIGGTETLNGKKIYGYNSNTGNGVGHTFAIPTLGINVPLVGVPLQRHQRLQPGPVLPPAARP